MNVSDAVSLIKKFDRPQDHRIFSDSVIETYPALRAEYLKVCPTPMCLGDMLEKAAQGRYSAVDWPSLMEADVQLIASNCIAFNGVSSEYGRMASSFLQHAQSLIRDAALKPVRPARQSGGKRLRLSQGASATAGAAVGSDAKAPPPPPPPSSSQPEAQPLLTRALRPSYASLRVPLGLKKVAVEEYAARGEARCVLPAPGGITASVVLDRFVQVVQNSHAEDEPLYPTGVARAVADALSRTLDAALLHVLLFARERVDVNVFLLRRCRGDTVWNAGEGEKEDGGGTSAHCAPVPWHRLVGPRFLLRLVLHFPQLGTIAAHQVSPAGGEILVGRVVPVLEDLLVFMDANAQALGLV